MISRRLIRLGLAALLAGALPSAWSDPTDQAQALRDSGSAPGAAVQQLIEQGQTAARAAGAVVEAFSDCAATYDAVAAAVEARPAEARVVVGAIAGMGECGCNAETLWARSRLESRLRPPAPFVLVGIADPCACSTTAIDAAAAVVPDQAEQLLAAALVAAEEPGVTLDSIGRRGDTSWARGLSAGADSAFQRGGEVCRGDDDLEDRFDPAAEWRVDSPSPGAHQARCEDGGLVVSEFSLSVGEGSYIELYNAGDSALEFDGAQTRLTIFYGENRQASHTIALAGRVEPGSTFVVGSPTLDAGLVGRLDQVEPGLAVAAGDAVSLSTPPGPENCACATPNAETAASAFAGDAEAPAVALGLPLPLSCRETVAEIMATTSPGPAFFAQEPGRVIRDPAGPTAPDVDPVASPN